MESTSWGDWPLRRVADCGQDGAGRYAQVVVIAVILVALAAVLWPVVARRKRSARLHDHFGAEYDRTVSMMGNEAKAQDELEGRRKHVGTLNIRPLSAAEEARWTKGRRPHP